MINPFVVAVLRKQLEDHRSRLTMVSMRQERRSWPIRKSVQTRPVGRRIGPTGNPN